MSRSQSVALVEIGLPQALQSAAIDVSTKVAVVNKLSGGGIPVIETACFSVGECIAPPDDAILQKITRPQGVSFLAAVDDIVDARAVLTAGADRLSVSVAASQTYSQRNCRRSIEEALSSAGAIVELARRHGATVRGHIPCATGCPYEGTIAPTDVASLAGVLSALGVYEISLDDTLGAVTPEAITQMVRAISREIAMENLAIRCCDRNLGGLANIHAALNAGVGVIDGAIGGFAHPSPAAASYVATEDILSMLDELGLRSGVDSTAVIEAAWLLADALERQPYSEAAFHARAR